MTPDAMPVGNAAGGILSTRARPKTASAPSAVVTLAWRAMLKIKHVPFQLFDVTIMPIMFTLLFTFMFGGAIANSPKEYIQFLLPGILVQTIIFITVYTGVGVNTDIQKGLFDRFRSLPMWQPAPILGALSGDLFRYTVASIVILIVGFLLGFRPQGGVVGVVGAFVLVLIFAVALSWIWIIIGMKVKTPESVMTTSFVFLMPLTFASNIFVGLETLPDWLRPIVANNPVTHLATASRAIIHGQSPGQDLYWVLGVSLLIVLLAAPVAMRLYYKER
ncbi:MAG TPA: ABC transporter permease [Candidatus Thermoplasmatota archaeon]|nr:ABC transporter permease [Candidatus Thermoplasmatota archaeon]